jgi:hypothetical protein
MQNTHGPYRLSLLGQSEHAHVHTYKNSYDDSTWGAVKGYDGVAIYDSYVKYTVFYRNADIQLYGGRGMPLTYVSLNET